MTAKIEILKGDITEMQVDAIVNAANTALILGGGVAGAIRTKGGPTIQDECNKHGPVPLGGAAITSAGNLPARYVIHAASMAPGGSTSARSLAEATLNSLRLAERYGVKTIAFPAIGSGIGGFPLRQCAQIMLTEVLNFLPKSRSLERVYFVLFDDVAFNTFKQVYAELIKTDSQNQEAET